MLLSIEEPTMVGISLIVPVLNEELEIREQLEALSKLEGFAEILVVDGGSCDGTLAIAGAAPFVRLLEAPRGRASQMNAGARAAVGDVLLFLHTDVRLPADAARWISEALRDPKVVAGAFRTWTTARGHRRWFGPLLHLADIRSRITSLPYGDQAMFVRARVFRELGGFPDLPLMEDLELSRRLRAVGEIRTVPSRVQVSGRRFLARPIFYTAIVNLLPLLYRLGAPPRMLASWYQNER